jgi:hypothetical protein
MVPSETTVRNKVAGENNSTGTLFLTVISRGTSRINIFTGIIIFSSYFQGNIWEPYFLRNIRQKKKAPS